jgi:hypothetical protein
MPKPKPVGVSNPIHKSVEDGTFRPQVVPSKAKPKRKKARRQAAEEIRKELEE